MERKTSTREKLWKKNRDHRTIRQQFQQMGQTKNLVKISLLGALSFLIMQVFRFPFPFAPGFMTADFGDVPGLLGGFALGPVAGMLIQLIKNLLKLFTSSTFGIGEVSNFIVGTVFVVVAAVYYQRHKTRRGAIVAMVMGSFFMAAIALCSNAFFIFPAYAKASGLDLNTMAQAVGKMNPLVKDFPTMLFFAIVPFNLVKAALECLVTFLLYKRVSPLLHE